MGYVCNYSVDEGPGNPGPYKKGQSGLRSSVMGPVDSLISDIK